jgi:hypothetical protein
MSRHRGKEIFAIIGGGDLSTARKLCSVQKALTANFDQYSFQNDIALVKINCGRQQVIELSEIEPSVGAFTDCVIYGYGSLNFETNMKPSSTLRFGSVRPISYSECEKVMGRVAAPLPGTGQFCARGGKPTFTDACSGKIIMLRLTVETHFSLAMLSLSLSLSRR